MHKTRIPRKILYLVLSIVMAAGGLVSMWTNSSGRGR